MALTARGRVYLDGLQFTTTPQVYSPLKWPKRVSVHPGIGGSVTVQDFGAYAKDAMVSVGSGSSGYLEQSVVEAIETKKNTLGATYSWTDWIGNEFTVFILSFEPVPTFIGSLWTYTLELKVMAITKLFGATYSGS